MADFVLNTGECLFSSILLEGHQEYGYTKSSDEECYLKYLTTGLYGREKAERMLEARSGASSQECCGKGLREIFPKIRCRAPELTLSEHQWSLGKDFVGKREHEHRVRGNYVAKGESLVFSLFCLLL